MADLPAEGAGARASRRAAWMSAPRRTCVQHRRALRDQGIGVIVVSTEPETVLSLADRIMVMKKGDDRARIRRARPSARTGCWRPHESHNRQHGRLTDRMTDRAIDRSPYRLQLAASASCATSRPFLTLLFLVVLLHASPARPSPRSTISSNILHAGLGHRRSSRSGLTFVILYRRDRPERRQHRQRHRHRRGVLHAAGC